MSDYRPWRILHLDLEKPLPDVQFDDSLGGIYTVFWWREIPLGDAWLAASELPLRSAYLRALALRRIAPSLAAAMEVGPGGEDSAPGSRSLASLVDKPLTSLAGTVADRETRAAALRAAVIVCTRDRPVSLTRTLASLERTLAPGDEIVVVDNAPLDDRTRRVASAYGSTRYIVELRPGLDIARNAGLRSAAGDLIVFCDDDVEVHSRWLARLKAAFLDADVMAATGLVLPATLKTESQYVFERYWGFARGFRPRRFDREYFRQHLAGGVPVWEIGAGASMAFRRALFEEIGGFDERLDAGAAGCSGDSELWYRVLAAHHVCSYAPDAVAFHHHRSERQDLNAQLYAYMRGHVTALLIQFERHRHWGNLRRLVTSLPYYYGKLLVRHLRSTDRRRTQTLRHEILGGLAGVRYYLRHRRTPGEVPPSLQKSRPPSDAVA
jgi:GT2 family glycosyltransferase